VAASRGCNVTQASGATFPATPAARAISRGSASSRWEAPSARKSWSAAATARRTRPLAQRTSTASIPSAIFRASPATALAALPAARTATA
jgi:hypothetical protein